MPGGLVDKRVGGNQGLSHLRFDCRHDELRDREKKIGKLGERSLPIAGVVFAAEKISQASLEFG